MRGGGQFRVGFDNADDFEIALARRTSHLACGVGMSGSDLADFDAFHDYQIRKGAGALQLWQEFTMAQTFATPGPTAGAWAATLNRDLAVSFFWPLDGSWYRLMLAKPS